jgi:hypothetical protein
MGRQPKPYKNKRFYELSVKEKHLNLEFLRSLGANLFSSPSAQTEDVDG